MLFNSVDFLIFFPVTLLVTFVLPKKVRYLWLLIASYYFYMCWNAKYALLLFASTLITYASGLLMEAVKRSGHTPDRQRRLKKWIVAGSFTANLGILFYFKYFNFVMGLLANVLARAHVSLRLPAVDVLLPVGISFYTFQALGYTMDVYRDEIYAEKNFFRYALFVSFFPQLVAGPIERSRNLLKQLAKPVRFCFENLREGLYLILWGYFLKIVLADRIALMVDTIYGNPAEYPGMYLLAATLLFAVQIYCDFAGYSTIAVGGAKILGISLMENFDAPYLSVSVADFWRRWHISLTSWFKDYLYIPLGGSRKGTLRKYINKMIVFLVSGLWHGASLSYVVWGGLNGLYQVIGEVTKPVRDRMVDALHLHRATLGHRLMQGLCTFALVDFSWIFFRAESIHSALGIVKSIFTVHNPWILFDGSLYKCGLDDKNVQLMLAGIMLLVLADICKRKKLVIRKLLMEQDYWLRYLLFALAVCGILLFGKWGPSFDQANFIYFQF